MCAQPLYISPSSMNDNAPARPTSRKALFFLMITVAIDSLGLGIVVPVGPELMQMFTDYQGIAVAAAWGGVLITLYAVMQFIFAPIMGSLADRYGRRPVLLLALAALGFDYILTGLAPTLVWLFLGRAVAGAAGATFSVANAYVADISGPENRGKYFGYIGAAWSLGFLLGPLLGGFFGEYGPRVPFFVAGALALLNVLYGYLVLPETLAPENRRDFELKRSNLFGAILHLRQWPAVFMLLFAVVFFQIAHDSLPATWSYYTALQLDWGPREIGYSLVVMGLLGIVVMAWLAPFSIARLGEKRTAFLGFVICSIGFVGLSTIDTDLELYAWLLPWSLMGFIMPSLRSIMSQEVPANSQGELQGAITSVMGLTAIFTPLLMTQAFRYFSSEQAFVHYPGIPMLLAGISMFLALAVALLGLAKTNIGGRPRNKAT